MFDYSPIVIADKLEKDDQGHIALIDLMFLHSLEQLKALLPCQVSVLDNEFMYLYLIQTMENRWLLTITTEFYVPEITVKYNKSIRITISELLYLVNHYEERCRILASLLPNSIYSNIYKQIKAEEN